MSPKETSVFVEAFSFVLGTPLFKNKARTGVDLTLSETKRSMKRGTQPLPALQKKKHQAKNFPLFEKKNDEERLGSHIVMGS